MTLVYVFVGLFFLILSISLAWLMMFKKYVWGVSMEKFKVIKIQYVQCKNKSYMRTIRKGIGSYDEAKRVKSIAESKNKQTTITPVQYFIQIDDEKFKVIWGIKWKEICSILRTGLQSFLNQSLSKTWRVLGSLWAMHM